jgi:hypothetical protein
MMTVIFFKDHVIKKLFAGFVLFCAGELVVPEDEEEEEEEEGDDEEEEGDDEEEEGDDEEEEGDDEEGDDEEGDGGSSDGWEDVEEEEEGDEEGSSDGWEDVEEEEEGDEKGSSDGWEDVEVDSDEESEGAVDTLSMAATSSEHAASSVPLDRRRVLSSDDFALIERLKEAYAKYVRDPRRRGGGKGRLTLGDVPAGGSTGDADETDGGHSAPAFAVTPDALAPQAKTRKTSKIERIARILEGRKENKFEHEGHAGGLTNKEKERKKNFVMVRKGKREVANKIRIANSTARWKSNNRVSSCMCWCCRVEIMDIFAYNSLRLRVFAEGAVWAG